MKRLAYWRDRVLYALHRTGIVRRVCVRCDTYEGGISCVAGKPGWGVDVCPADVPPNLEAYQ